MILDNQQAIPDIVISRHGGVPNIHNNDYNNIQSPVRHNGGRRENQSSISQRTIVSPKNLFVSGNNNGSPRHVPKNGNIYIDNHPHGFGFNKHQKVNLHQKTSEKQSTNRIHHNKEVKCNIPLPRESIAMNSRTHIEQHKENVKNSGNKKKRDHFTGVPTPIKQINSNTNHLNGVNENNFDKKEKHPNTKNKISTKNKLNQNDTSGIIRNAINISKFNSSLNPSLQTKAINYQENPDSFPKIKNSAVNHCSDYSDLDLKYFNPQITQDKIDNVCNLNIDNNLSLNESVISVDSLASNPKGDYKNLDLNWQSIEWDKANGSFYMDTDKSEEENNKIFITNSCNEFPIGGNYMNGKHSKLSSMENIKDISFDSEEIKLLTDDECSSSETSSSYECKMAVVNCNGDNYLTKLLVNDTDIHGLKILGRIGVGSNNTGCGMSLENPEVSSQMLYTELRKDIQTENASILSSQGTDNEFEHEAADYQWLLDYEYRENYSRDSLATGNDGSVRVSILQTAENAANFSYEAISRNLDANLAEIDMDDFRSEDIHQILSLPSIENEYEDEDENRYEEDYTTNDLSSNCLGSGYSERCCKQTNLQKISREISLNNAKENSYNYLECHDDEDVEECSGVSGEMSIYKSGPLFSPLREPIPPSFSVDSLDSGSIHEDLILTCQANKDNYTIAFEGSFVHNSSNSDYRDTGTSESGESATWSTENLEDHIPVSDMTHSDQPYTTWSRVSRRSSQTPDSESSNSVVRHDTTPIPIHNPPKDKYLGHRIKYSNDSKSSSMPNLMRRSLMRKSLENSGQCMKVYDLQKSLRSNHLSQSKVDANNFSLLRLFMKQKSIGKDVITRSSSFTDPSNEGYYSSSENPSTNNESSDWPMNSQSETDLERSSSPVNNFAKNIKTMNRYNTDSKTEIFESENTERSNRIERIERLNNNNIHDNVALHLNTIENLGNFDDGSLRDAITCSKPPMTSPIREEPEGMEISTNQELYSKANSEIQVSWNTTESSGSEMYSDSNYTNKNRTDIRKNKRDTTLMDSGDIRLKETKSLHKNETLKHNSSTCRSESERGLTINDKVSASKRLEERKKVGKTIRERPKPRPRITKESNDQCLQTSDLKVSTPVNTTKILEQKEIYVYYPNYALPDLNFLKDKQYSLDTKIFLVPQHYSIHDTRKTVKTKKPERPLSHNDITKIKKENFSHVEDWESLNFLLPKELKEILRDNSDCMETMRPSFCRPIRSTKRPVSCDILSHRTLHESKGSSVSVNSTQPSSGYRGSSTMLNDSDSEENTLCGNHSANCLNFARKIRPTSSDGLSCNSNMPETQPLPRGVLRKSSSIKGTKRNSCDIDNKLRMRQELLKRRSLPEFDESKEDNFSSINTENYKIRDSKQMQCSCVNHCTGFCSVGLRSKHIIDPSNLPKTRSSTAANKSEIKNIKSSISTHLSSRNNKSLLHKSTGEQKPSDLLIKKNIQTKQNEVNSSGKQRDRIHTKFSIQGDEDLPPMLYSLGEKKTLVISVRSAVEKLVQYYKLASPKEKVQAANSLHSSEVAQLVLNKLCPAVYALLSDGLLPSLHSLFGKITNSVWKVVETTSQLGPSTKALHDLVMTLNGEECLTEGPIKFNAFIFGLLNLRSLDPWLSYLRTREVALQKHYHPESFLYLANTAMRSLFDDLLFALRPLALLPFHLDILFEYKALHASLLKMEEILMASRRDSNIEGDEASLFDHLVVAKESKEFRNVVTQQDRIRAFMKAISPQVEIRRDRSNSPRPRSCCENENNQDIDQNLKKRWSGVQLGSNLVTALDKLLNDGDESSSRDYTDSIDNPRSKCHKNCSAQMKSSDCSSKYTNTSEHSATDKDIENEKFLDNPHTVKNSTNDESEGDRFRRLQLKWEQMAIHPLRTRNSQNTNRNSYGPDTSISPGCTSRSRIPRPVSMTSPQRPYKPFEPVFVTKEKPKPIPRRSLRDKTTVDSVGRNVVKSRLRNTKSPMSSADTNRASSVPGRGIDHVAPLERYDIYRRNVTPRSSSHGRAVLDDFRYVQTLHHRLATDNGHLSFNKGDLLSVVVDVNEKYILCCLNERKGLVPRNSVIPFNP